MKEKENKNYEELYYDLLYEYRKIKQELSEVKQDLTLISKNDKRKIDIKNILLQQLKEYKKNNTFLITGKWS